MIYILIIMLLAAFALLHDILGVRQGKTVSYWFSYFILVCLAGFRYKVGGDTYNYMFMHDYLPNLGMLFTTEVGFERLQPLWLVFSAISKSIGEDFFILQILHSVVINAVLFNYFEDNSKFRHTAVFIYSFSLFPIFNFEILRESLAICVFLIAVQYYLSKKWLRYYLLSVVAFLFHFSAVILFILPLIKNVQLKAGGLLILFTVSALLSPVLNSVLNSTIAVQMFGVAFGVYVNYNYTIFGLISILIMYLIVPYFFTWVTQRRLSIKYKYGSLAGVGLLVAACIPLYYIFYRFFNYFSVFFMLMACDAFHGVASLRKLRRIKLIVMLVSMSLIFIFYAGKYFQDTSHLSTSTRWYNRWYPYYSIFNPVSFPPRDVMIENQNRESYGN